MKRREFLKAGALAVAGAAVTASGLIPAGAAEPATLATLKPHEAQTLLRVCRRIFPHPELSDACYLKVVADLDAACQGDPQVAAMMAAGVAQLDTAHGAQFVELSEAQQDAALSAVADSPFFQKVRGVELVSLYSEPSVWKAFGYQGPSYPFGGYLHHGFNDLTWLPNPPEAASPKPA